VKLAAFKANVNASDSISATNIANVKIAKIWINLKILKLSIIQE